MKILEQFEEYDGSPGFKLDVQQYVVPLKKIQSLDFFEGEGFCSLNVSWHYTSTS